VRRKLVEIGNEKPDLTLSHFCQLFFFIVFSDRFLSITIFSERNFCPDTREELLREELLGKKLPGEESFNL
jgi:hypothetical protein